MKYSLIKIYQIYKKIEISFAKYFDRFPKIKYLIKAVRLILFKKKQKYYIHEKAYFIKLQSSSCDETFFGYYNITPWNNRGNVIILKKQIDNNCNSLDICIYRNMSDNIEVLEKTLAWNWQQGCLIQWLDDDKIIFNDYDNNIDKHYSKIIDVVSRERYILSKPIYSVCKNRYIGITLNFDRLTLFKSEYGYKNKKKLDILNLKDDGIWKIDIKSDKTQLIISYLDILNIGNINTDYYYDHYINHLDYSPSGNKFMFLHRFKNLHGAEESRLIVADSNGKNLKCIYHNSMISHCCWIDNMNILSWTRKKEIGDRYFIFNLENNEMSLLGGDLFYSDGHPSISPDGNWMVTDTYPDKSRMSKLILFNLNISKYFEIGEFFQPLHYDKEKRCDLHPRWSIDNKNISFDSCHSGKRLFYVINIEEIIKGYNE